ncbi:hypothetical protein PL11201_80057 [Planktothrix sp. PCC 11201]|uniref:aspartyl/asparaginyl beta-hydroxylase domain-containing protein n=1 Tax=Planktothrix sp. PCC 11201 TaxID=1729650 RepID=UPI00091FD821|nr:aspartyl/asparaginyl beta-hydroxylase domain-containing protein [Planktothrix sp. PCC 11201]SKB15748.1 hypothetical protein PL11201_80057 [Planktothrix sp. PCC 11201]
MTEIFEIATKLGSLELNISLPIKIDQKRLLADFHNVYSNFVETGHFDNIYGGWKSIGLITSGGEVGETRNESMTNKPYAPTPALEFCPYIKKFLDDLPTQKTRIRFMSLAPGAIIDWHHDNMLTVDKMTGATEARFHIPIITNPKISFKMCHDICKWEAGNFYYADFSFPHAVKNNSNESRIHLVMDLMPNDEIRSLFPESFLQAEQKRHRFRMFCQKACSVYLKRQKLQAKLSNYFNR